MVEHNDRSSDEQNTTSGLSINDVSDGMLIDIDGDVFIVRQTKMYGKLVKPVNRDKHDTMSLSRNSQIQQMFQEHNVSEVKTYNPDTHTAIPRLIAAIAGDELDNLILDDSSDIDIVKARDSLWSALGYKKDE